MHGKLTQPKIDGYISWLRRNDHFGMTSCIYDDKSQKLLDELFALLEQIAPESPNGVRTLWLRAERGPIEDFGNAAEEIEEGNYDSEEEFIDAWKSWFPEDVKWYHFQAVEDKAEGYRAVAVRHSYVIVQDKRREPAGWPCEISEFVQWLVDGVRSCIEMLKAGTYNDVVRENLPPQHRTGTIRRRDFWNVWPDARADFFKNISPVDSLLSPDERYRGYVHPAPPIPDSHLIRHHRCVIYQWRQCLAQFRLNGWAASRSQSICRIGCD